MMAEDKPRRRRITDEERALWRSVTRSVSPLRRHRRNNDDDVSADAPAATGAKPKPAKANQAKPKVSAPLPQWSAPPPPKPPALAELDRRARQRLARGSEPIDARLDLHGRTQGEAHTALIRFLRKAQAGDARTVLVITGKGGDATGERGVLRRQVPLWLALPEFRSLVVGFGPAAIGHGGEGALYVRVRRGR
jgi:DNA-nicking Smr family endonuclease